MDQSTFIRAKLNFRDQVKVARLDERVDKSFCSIENLTKLIFKSFPEIEEMVDPKSPSTRSPAAVHRLQVKCEDIEGDYVTVENEIDLEVAMEGKRKNLSFLIDVKETQSSVSASTWKVSKRAGEEQEKSASSSFFRTFSSNSYSVTQHRPQQLCRHFQRGQCREGAACKFSHDIDKLAVKVPSVSSSDRGGQQLCRHFQRGHCREGESCRFSHEIDKFAVKQLSPSSNNYGAKQQRPEQVCRHFERGHCRDGPTCRFSHEIENFAGNRSSPIIGIRRDQPRNNVTALELSSSADPVAFRRTVDSWLANQFSLDAAGNIEQMSGEKGLDMLSKVVEQRNMPDDTINLFVKVLVKEEVRSSLLRQHTNKIYGVLLGSPFLLQLHAHIASYLRIGDPSPEDVEPYLLLIEELQSRTEHGWKEVPLDAIHSIVLRLEESPEKAVLLATATRLIDQRDKLQRLLTFVPRDKRLQGAEFRQKPLVATKEELLKFHGREELPVNLIGRKYASVDDYLETHFRLLREDCIDPLRQGIRAYRSGMESGSQELRIYSGVKLTGVRCGDSGVEYVVSFHISGHKNAAQDAALWESSKRLMFGALLCISSDEFETFVWGVVGLRDPKELAKGRVAIRIIGESEENVSAALQSGQPSKLARPYVMVESTAAYFEAYIHVLKSLQREEMEHIPFTKYLLHLEAKVDPPSYLLGRNSGDEYDFLSAFPEIRKKLGRSSFRIHQEWPSEWADSLDQAQQDALKQALTKELAVIQGPPGTGKTYLGLLLVKILLANLESPNLERSLHYDSYDRDLLTSSENKFELSGPILVICYTNHALDQFLEGIYRSGHTDLIRIGGRGKSELLKGCNLQTLLQKQRMEPRGVNGSHHRLLWHCRSQKNKLELQIHDSIDTMGSKSVTHTLLEGVATREQIDSLFLVCRSTNASFAKIVDFWLEESSCVDPYLAVRFFLSRSSDLNYSQPKYEPLEKMKYEPLDKSFGDPFDEPTIDPNLRGSVKLFPASGDEGGWTQVARRRRNRHITMPRVANEINHRPEVAGETAEVDQVGHDDDHVEEDGGLAHEDEDNLALQHFVDVQNVWELNIKQRRKLHDYWLAEIWMNNRKKLKELLQNYEEACRDLNEVDNEIQLSLLRRSKVVGMTTTAAARCHDVVKALKPTIVIVEEAAEVLEGHILACLGPSVEHLILIGDHVQLRPSVAVYRLATKHNLDVSMFERLVRSGVEHVTLQEQRRMRPEIAKLVKSLYPKSTDHESVTKYEPVLGISSNVFFLDHKAEETQSHDASSKVNPTEAKMVVEFCLYLLNQGRYEAKQIAILSMYSGQLQEIRTLLAQRSSNRLPVKPVGQSTENGDCAEETSLLPRVSSVDDYQGEESDIIILSLVRSNTILTDDGEGKIGFLKTPNRICVALTRARMGLFIFGNADLLAQRSPLWKQVTDILRDDGALGPQIELYCQNHPKTKTRISKAEDFKQVEDGGCSLACEFQLDCGHACPRRCHPGSHDLAVCPKPCLRPSEVCPHICNLRCHGAEDCPPCQVIVSKQMPGCVHKQSMECSRDVNEEMCRSLCTKSLPCGHTCTRLCGRPCTDFCDVRVVKLLPCRHTATLACHSNPDFHSCSKPCGFLLPVCNHPCAGSCGKCKRGTEHVPCEKECGRNLPCGHHCKASCSVNCPPCHQECRKRCVHSVCKLPCGEPCIPCLEPCSWNCTHFKCSKRCHEMCTRPRCDFPCPHVFRGCGHSCIGLCGETCPDRCRVCNPQTFESIMLMKLEEFEESDRFVQLTGCGHIFEVTNLDTWMDADDTAAQQSDGSIPIKPKQCPECRCPIWQTLRYSNVIKGKLAQVEEVKKKIYGHDYTRKGNLLLQEGDHVGALSLFRLALKQNPGQMEAHFGTGCAFSKMKSYEKSFMHFSFIVKRSSFATELAYVTTSSDGDGNEADFITKFYSQSFSRATDSVAIQAIIQWASSFTQIQKFGEAIKLCDAVLGRNLGNQLAAEIKDKAGKCEIKLVVQAMAADVGSSGHWYTCPNGHYYTIGECGGANQIAICPDCKARVGGASHRLVDGNRHSNIDGSERSSWPS